jgi:phosphate/sulfate permease
MIPIFLAWVTALFMAWVIGADSVSASFGPVVSSRALGIMRSSLLAGIAAFLGAVFQGEMVTETISSGFVKGVQFGPAQATVILFVAALIIAWGIWQHYPIPIVFTLMGATLGAGLGLGGELVVPQIAKVFSCWLLLPLFSAVIGFSISKLLMNIIKEGANQVKLLRSLLIFFGIYTAYTAGANHIGLAIGSLSSFVHLSNTWLLLLGGLGIILGAWMGSPKIIHAIAREYAELGPRKSIAALVGTSLLAQGATFFGIPIPFNLTILSAIMGSSFATPHRSLGGRKIWLTVGIWLFSFVFTFSLTFGIEKILIR